MLETNQSFCLGEEMLRQVDTPSIGDPAAVAAAMAPFLRGEAERQREQRAVIQSLVENPPETL